MNSFWSFEATYFNELRIWCTMHSCTSVFGNMLRMASVKPFRLSVQAISMSLSPPVVQVGKDLQPKIGPLAFRDVHAQHLLVTVPVDSQYVVDRPVADPAVHLDLVVHCIQPDDAVHRVQRPSLPGLDIE